MQAAPLTLEGSGYPLINSNRNNDPQQAQLTAKWNAIAKSIESASNLQSARKINSGRQIAPNV